VIVDETKTGTTLTLRETISVNIPAEESTPSAESQPQPVQQEWSETAIASPED